MREVKGLQLFRIEGNLYWADFEESSLEIGMILFDSRMGDFVVLETQKDLSNYRFVAPEMYAVMKLDQTSKV